MKVLSVNSYNKLNLDNKAYQRKTFQPEETPASLNTPVVSNLAFRSFSPKYFKAKQYLESCNNKSKNISLYHFDLNKLDGIQEGLKTFKNLNMKEIAFVLSTITEFAVMRGCYNMCSHCYADAKPPIKERDNYINKMSWEDFTGLTGDIKELNKRLGFYATTPLGGYNNFIDYVVPFHDADCIDIVLKDKDGKEYDFIDIYKELGEATGKGITFDTAGWFPNNAAAQKRAEKFVDYFKYRENFENVDQFNISLNPFHSSNTRSIMLAREGKTDVAKKLRDLYTTRMANVLFTFTPLLKYKNFNILGRAAQNGTSGLDGFCENDILNLFMEIMQKLEQLYVNDMNSNQKFVKNKQQILSYTQRYINRYDVEASLNVTERLKKLSNENTFHREKTDAYIERNKNLIKNSSDIIEMLKPKSFYGLMDANGKYYLTTFASTYPTEIELNLSTNGKQTAPIRPNLQEDLIITKNKINTIVTK